MFAEEVSDLADAADESPSGDLLRDREFLVAEFPIKKTRSYLNNASIGVVPTSAVERVASFYDEVQTTGRNNYPQWCDFADGQAKDQIAQLIGAEPSEVAFTKNTTEGILTVANGLRWRPGDNVIIPDIEYPSNVYPWMKLRSRGVELRWVANRSGAILGEDIKELIDDRTRLVSLSATQFSNGHRQDLAELSEICHARGVLIHLDGIQWVGALAMDVSRHGIDFLSVGGHKWLLGPIGTGFFYCRTSALELIDPPNVGYHSVDKPAEHMDYDLIYRAGAGRFEEALVNFPGIWGLHAAVALQLRIGTKAIEAHITNLIREAADGLRSKGYEIVTPANQNISGILSFRHPAVDPEPTVTRLRDAAVDIASRGGALRISPSYYNDRNDIERLLECLP